MVHLKRTLFLGAWGDDALRAEVRAYRYFDEYLAALADPAAALPRILLGMSRVLAFAGLRGRRLSRAADRAFRRREDRARSS